MLKNFVLNRGMIEMKIEIVYLFRRSSHVRRLFCGFSISCFSHILSSLGHVSMM